jgi:TetR/AcrR family transcriptional regulator, transcriptional repressor for nem operon
MYIFASSMDTREKILTAMFTDVHKNGFQGLRADKVIKEMDVTKGAMYHYFPSKDSIGLAIIDEIIEPNYLKFYQDLDIFDGNPIDMLHFHLKDLVRMATDENISLGCPLNNLVQEMSPLSEEFRIKLKRIVDGMTTSVTKALKKGQKNGFVKKDSNPQAVADFYISSIEGAYSIAKVQRNIAVFKSNMAQLSLYLEILRG